MEPLLPPTARRLRRDTEHVRLGKPSLERQQILIAAADPYSLRMRRASSLLVGHSCPIDSSIDPKRFQDRQLLLMEHVRLRGQLGDVFFRAFDGLTILDKSLPPACSGSPTRMPPIRTASFSRNALPAGIIEKSSLSECHRQSRGKLGS